MPGAKVWMEFMKGREGVFFCFLFLIEASILKVDVNDFRWNLLVERAPLIGGTIGSVGLKEKKPSFLKLERFQNGRHWLTLFLSLFLSSFNRPWCSARWSGESCGDPHWSQRFVLCLTSRVGLCGTLQDSFKV